LEPWKENRGEKDRVENGWMASSVGIATDTIMLLAHNKQLLLVYA